MLPPYLGEDMTDDENADRKKVTTNYKHGKIKVKLNVMDSKTKRIRFNL